METDVRTDLVPAVSRAGAILDLLADKGTHGLSAGEIARSLGLPKSSTTNICLALQETELLERVDSRFRLGRRLVELGGAYIAGMDEIQTFYSACNAQENLRLLTSRVAVLDGLDVLYLARYDGVTSIRLTANIGDRFPAHCTATGKVLLSLLPKPVLDERLRGVRQLQTLTEKSIATIPQLHQELNNVRAAGYAIDAEEATPGVTCVAIAATGLRTDSSPMAISATMITSNTNEQTFEIVLDELRRVARAMSNPLIPAMSP